VLGSMGVSVLLAERASHSVSLDLGKQVRLKVRVDRWFLRDLGSVLIPLGLLSCLCVRMLNGCSVTVRALFSIKH
jgi:hypothetical protein